MRHIEHNMQYYNMVLAQSADTSYPFQPTQAHTTAPLSSFVQYIGFIKYTCIAICIVDLPHSLYIYAFVRAQNPIIFIFLNT